MEYHGSRLGTQARRTEPAEPSWPKVIATTARLWVERHPVFGRRATGRRRITAALVAVAVIALAAGVVGVFLGHATTAPRAAAAPAAQPAGAQSGSAQPGGVQPRSDPAALGASAATRGVTARWIAAQVAPSAVVACDPAMCAALQADGIAATRLVALGTTAADPLGSDLVVATAAVRSQFGARLESVYAPALIASFGTGAGRIDVRAIAPDGAAAYQSSAAADLRNRISAGSQLLGNPRITVGAGAKAALRDGDVDSRLLMLLAALAVQQPVLVSSFGGQAPGAGPAVPLRSAVIAPRAAGAKPGALRQSMLSFIDAQQQPYLPLHASFDGASALTVEYAAPSPLGLLSGP
jgi:hypothetical protein